MNQITPVTAGIDSDAVRTSPPDATEPVTVSVTIYVAQHCFNCVYAYEVGAIIRQTLPQVHVKFVDVEKPEGLIPEIVFATPTYLLNGRLWWLGNPSPQQAVESLRKTIAEIQRSET